MHILEFSKVFQIRSSYISSKIIIFEFPHFLFHGNIELFEILSKKRTKKKKIIKS